MLKLKKEIIKFSRILYEQGLNHSHSGNLSIRADNGILIKKHGVMSGYMTEKDVVLINLKDSKKDELASVEAKVHRAVYLNNPEIKAVAHAHALHATILSFKRNSIKPVDSEGCLYLSEVPVLSCRQTVCSDEVAKKMPELISKYKAVVVKGHGVFAAGKTLEEACMYLSVTENASKIIYMLGGLK